MGPFAYFSHPGYKVAATLTMEGTLKFSCTLKGGGDKQSLQKLEERRNLH